MGLTGLAMAIRGELLRYLLLTAVLAAIVGSFAAMVISGYSKLFAFTVVLGAA